MFAARRLLSAVACRGPEEALNGQLKDEGSAGEVYLPGSF